MAEERVTFSPAQQAVIDELIKRKYTEAYEKAKAKYLPEYMKLRARITELENKKSIFPWRR